MPIPQEVTQDSAGHSLCPKTYPAQGITDQGVTALFYDGPTYRGKPTRVFAWLGMPETTSQDKAPGNVGSQGKVPGMVLVHGGGGTAFADWVRLWNQRGYAAIAMDTGGCIPIGSNDNWQPHDWPGPKPWHQSFDQIDDPIRDQWPYQAITHILRAHALLAAQDRVDAGRIGITGISWGGYLTCLATAVDPQLEFAVPVYGCGFLGQNSKWLEDFQNMGQEKAQRWLSLWDPSQYLPNINIPMLWVTGTNDGAYPMDSWQKSYRLPRGPRTLCLRVAMPHGHGGAGENPQEIHAFANQHLKNQAALVRITAQGCDHNQFWAQYETERSIVRAELNYTCENVPWPERQWSTQPADLDTKASRAAATLTARATAAYINLLDDQDLVVSAEHVDLPGGQA